MADNIDEEHLENQVNNQSESSPYDFIPTKNTETVTQNQEAEDMEVHHHTPHEHGKKNWKSYFWEFLMLFLAVFCGFLAEYQLEHKIEKDREKQYIISMVKELEADTAQINFVLKDSVRSKGIDTLVRYINTHDLTKLDNRQLYFYNIEYLNSVQDMNFSKNTLSQLKNSGNMRLIRKQEVVDSLNMLDNKINEIEKQMRLVYEHYQFHKLLGAEIFNYWYYYSDSASNRIFTDIRQYLTQPVAPPLLTKDYQKLLKFANLASSWNSLLRNYHEMLKENYNFSSRLIAFIKNKYNL